MDPTELISTGKLNAICVSVAYRLNVFGFLASEELKQESNGESAGNFGQRRPAVKWSNGQKVKIFPFSFLLHGFFLSLHD